MLEELLRPDTININLESEDKDEVFEEMTELFVASCPGLDRSEVLDSLFEREKKMSTGIIQGIAIPHAITAKIKKPICAVGISKEGIDYEALDGKPVHIIFMFLFPADDAALHLNILKRLALMFDVPDFYKSLMDKNSCAQVVQAIVQAEQSL